MLSLGMTDGKGEAFCVLCSKSVIVSSVTHQV